MVQELRSDDTAELPLSDLTHVLRHTLAAVPPATRPHPGARRPGRAGERLGRPTTFRRDSRDRAVTGAAYGGRTDESRAARPS